MRSEKLWYDHILTQNLSLIVVLDNEDVKPTILGGLLLEVISKYDPPCDVMVGDTYIMLKAKYRLLSGCTNIISNCERAFYFIATWKSSCGVE